MGQSIQTTVFMPSLDVSADYSDLKLSEAELELFKTGHPGADEFSIEVVDPNWRDSLRAYRKINSNQVNSNQVKQTASAVPYFRKFENRKKS